LSSLDRALSDYLIVEIKRILREMKQTAIYVTHDQEEAFSIADRVVLMKAGSVEQMGTPEEIYHHPATNFVARFLGLSNLISGIVIDGADQAYIESPLGRIPFDGKSKGQVSLLIRPDSASINSGDGIILEGEVIEKTFQGNLYQVIISSLDREFKFYFPTTTKIPEKGEHLQFTINPSGIIPINEFQP